FRRERQVGSSAAESGGSLCTRLAIARPEPGEVRTLGLGRRDGGAGRDGDGRNDGAEERSDGARPWLYSPRNGSPAPGTDKSRVGRLKYSCGRAADAGLAGRPCSRRPWLGTCTLRRGAQVPRGTRRSAMGAQQELESAKRLASDNPVRFPNESEEYRRAR